MVLGRDFGVIDEYRGEGVRVMCVFEECWVRCMGFKEMGFISI